MTLAEFKKYVFAIFCTRLSSQLQKNGGWLIDLDVAPTGCPSRNSVIDCVGQSKNFFYSVSTQPTSVVGKVFTLIKSKDVMKLHELDGSIYGVIVHQCPAHTLVPCPKMVERWVRTMKDYIIQLNQSDEPEHFKEFMEYLCRSSGFVHVRFQVSEALRYTLIGYYVAHEILDINIGFQKLYGHSIEMDPFFQTIQAQKLSLQTTIPSNVKSSANAKMLRMTLTELESTGWRIVDVMSHDTCKFTCQETTFA